MPFGPIKNGKAPACRGACGMDCPGSCEQGVQFECAGAGTPSKKYKSELDLIVEGNKT